MRNYFTLIYIKTNRFSDEKICIGMLANFDGVPYFGYSSKKLNIALKFTNNQLNKSIKRSLNILEQDVNKFIKGEEPLSLFDMPYSKKILEKLTLKKRGIVQYSDLKVLSKSVDFSKLYKKYVADEWKLSRPKSRIIELPFKKRFFEFVNQKKFNSFNKKYKLTQENFPTLIAPLTIDLLKRDKSYVAFKLIDLTSSASTIQRNITQFKTIINALNQKALADGLSKGRYYMVYEQNSDKKELINKIQLNEKAFELIKLSEIRDKV
jgi:hypothetical protein